VALSLRAGLFCVVASASGCVDAISFPADSRWPAAEVGEWVGQERFAVTVNMSDRIAYMPADGVRAERLGEVVVGNVPVELEGPHHVAVAPDGKFLYYNLSNYVPGSGSGPHGAHGAGRVPGSVVKLDARTSRKVGEVIVDRNPGDIVVSDDGETAFVTHYDLTKLAAQLALGKPVEDGYSSLAVIETGTMKRLAMVPVCATAHGMGLSRDQRELYVVCAQSDELVVMNVVDRARPTVKARLSVGPVPGPLGQPNYAPYALSVSPADGSVWISNNNSADVRIYDPTTAQMDPSRVVITGGISMFGAFSSDGATFYVPSQGNDRLTVVDTMTMTTSSIAFPDGACLNAHAFVMAPSGQSAAVVCEGDKLTRQGTVVAMRVVPLVAVGYAEVGMFPDGAAWMPAIQ